jgi:hypothetical protein
VASIGTCQINNIFWEFEWQFSFDFEDIDKYKIDIIKILSTLKILSCFLSWIVFTDFYYIGKGHGSNLITKFQLFNIISKYFEKFDKIKNNLSCAKATKVS